MVRQRLETVHRVMLHKFYITQKSEVVFFSHVQCGLTPGCKEQKVYFSGVETILSSLHLALMGHFNALFKGNIARYFYNLVRTWLSLYSLVSIYLELVFSVSKQFFEGSLIAFRTVYHPGLQLGPRNWPNQIIFLGSISTYPKNARQYLFEFVVLTTAFAL